ncbi:MAG: ABC transporter substrate-binding protein [Gammaproteobacteria bacterium]|nr:ABC transporter substrate-binding protein [Gammaproteobacteria bacterium]
MNGGSKHRGNKTRIAALYLIAGLVLFSHFIATAAASASNRVAVFYPEIREPFKAVFKNIIRGVESGINEEIIEYKLEKDYDPEDLARQLEQENIDLVVALGRRAQIAAEKAAKDLPIIVGGVQTVQEPIPDNLAGISLAPDPQLLFSQLKKMAPEISKITVIYNPERNSWLIEYARTAAQKEGLELVTLAADNLHESAKLYRGIFERQGPTNAIWLLHDPATLDERAILPLVLKEAWNKRLVLFSSNPSHVARGVLFALYPDNISMGKSLGLLASSKLKRINGKIAGMRPLQDVLIAVNIRTAEHLGLNLTRKQQSEFNLLLPQ